MTEVATENATLSRSTRWLSRWMAGVGILYLVFALNLTSFVVAPGRIESFVPRFDAPLDSVAFAVATDLAFMAGLTHAVLGVYLLWASRRPMAYLNLVPLVIAIEVVVGIVDDLYLLARPYTVATIYLGFIVLHLVVIGTGYFAYRQATSDGMDTT